MTTIAVILKSESKTLKYFTRIYFPKKDLSFDEIHERVSDSLENHARYHKKAKYVIDIDVEVYIETENGLKIVKND